jgi:hypothetical protein
MVEPRNDTVGSGDCRIGAGEAGDRERAHERFGFSMTSAVARPGAQGLGGHGRRRRTLMADGGRE